MFRVLKCLSATDVEADHVTRILDSHFHPELVTSGGSWRGDELSLDETLEEWGKLFVRRLPHARHKRLRYICSTAYYFHNHVGRACQRFVWPVFFKTFPNGRILIVKLEENWFRSVWPGQPGHLRDPEDQYSSLIKPVPQEMSGLQAENFPLNILELAALGIYPLILFDVAHAVDLTFVYVPDLAIKHSQMKQPGAFCHILWRLHHVYDDQWTFDSSRGPKSAAPAKAFNPSENIEFIEWTITQIRNRMEELLVISDFVQREQFAMTFSRAAVDAILAVSTQLPYMSKVFFFTCLDKLANMLVQINAFDSETNAWSHLVSLSFLEGELQDFMAEIPGAAGRALRSIVVWVSENLQIDNITPEILRDYRNSHHGYHLRAEIVKRIYNHSGELHNDITLLATPLILYVLSRQWAQAKDINKL
jgi:hypothetical protein